MVRLNPTMKIHYNTSISFILVFFIYTFAFGLAQVFLIYLPQNWHPIAVLAMAVFSSASFIFLFSRAFNNSSIIDPYWSVAPIIFVFFFLRIAEDNANSYRQIIALIAVLLWGTRLTLNWARGWKGLHHEDWRHKNLKKGSKTQVFLLDYFGLHIFQAGQIFLGMLPLYPAISLSQNDVNGIDILAFAIALSGIALSLIADEQQRIFKKRNSNPQSFINTGLWRLSRHPNYVGEFLFWAGIFLLGLNGGIEYSWTIIGCISMYLMFRLASIPMMEKHLLKTRINYEAYKKETPPFFPIKIPFLKSEA